MKVEKIHQEGLSGDAAHWTDLSQQWFNSSYQQGSGPLTKSGKTARISLSQVLHWADVFLS